VNEYIPQLVYYQPNMDIYVYCIRFLNTDLSVVS